MCVLCRAHTHVYGMDVHGRWGGGFVCICVGHVYVWDMCVSVCVCARFYACTCLYVACLYVCGYVRVCVCVGGGGVYVCVPPWKVTHSLAYMPWAQQLAYVFALPPKMPTHMHVCIHPQTLRVSHS